MQYAGAWHICIPLHILTNMSVFRDIRNAGSPLTVMWLFLGSVILKAIFYFFAFLLLLKLFAVNMINSYSCTQTHTFTILVFNMLWNHAGSSSTSLVLEVLS